MPNKEGRYNRQEVLESKLPYFIPRSQRWNGEQYTFAVLLSKTRCKELGVPILGDGHEQPSAFLYAPNAGRGTNDLDHRYHALYDRTDAYEAIKARLHPREIMGTRPEDNNSTE
ncbi:MULTISPECIES: hypothetical protein [Paenibacillus]|uniref:hypothetical protein n=1 Tax=Paenibacillus TaxID=44249 RepID=UPI00096DFA55|nr:hypothetical protein [Paenibacillus odorifer]OME04010.1 hypothetical protein BSK60_33305 [Paenibacillus odorifer]